MYTEPGFYDLEPGAIGTLHYKINMIKHMSEEEKQAYVSRASNERMRAFMMNMTYGMNGNGPTDPLNAFIKARQDSWGELEDSQVGMEPRETQIQIGQKESHDLILKLEARDDFGGWMNPAFVDMIKEQFKTTNNENI